VQDLVAGVLLVVPMRKTTSAVPMSHRSSPSPVSATACGHHCVVVGGDGFFAGDGAALAGAAARTTLAAARRSIQTIRPVDGRTLGMLITFSRGSVMKGGARPRTRVGCSSIGVTFRTKPGRSCCARPKSIALSGEPVVIGTLIIQRLE